MLKPIRIARKQLSANSAWVGDVIPIIASNIDALREMEVPPNESTFQNLLHEHPSVRVQILLETDKRASCAWATEIYFG